MKKLDLNILFAEDEETVRDSLTRMLSSIFENVKSFENGQDAFEYYEQHGADIIVTDVSMPKMDGFELVKKSKLINSELPVIIVTAFSDVDNLRTALDLQVDKLLSKPVNIDSLFDSLEKIKSILDTKKELEKEKLKHDKFKSAVASSDLFITVDSNFNIKDYNQLAKEQFKLEKNNSLGVISKELKKEIVSKALDLENFHTIIDDTENKRFYSFSSIATDFKIENEKITKLDEITLLFRDITHSMRQKENLINSLYTDSLTSLPNRASLIKYFAESQIANKSLMIIDISFFSDINSFYGVETGDLILNQTAKVIEEFLLSTNLNTKLYKLDADRFGLLITKEENQSQKSQSIALEKFSNSLIGFIESKEYLLKSDEKIHLSVKVGRNNQEIEDLMGESLLSLEYAKTHNIKNVTYTDFENEISQYKNNLKMQTILKKAFNEDRIIPFFQPIVNKDGKVEKYEALARIVDGDKIYTPYYFLEVAKKGVLYNQLTKIMITKVFEIFKNNDKKVSINLSLMDIVNPEILNFIKDIFEKYPTMKYRVTFELLESESFDDIQHTNEVCNYLRTLGAYIAIDDFGSGFSNFSYFADLDIDIIKIDASLTKKVNTLNGKIIIKNIINMAKELDCKIIIEFVEDKELFDHLKSLNIDMFQGYYFSKPLPWEEIE